MNTIIYQLERLIKKHKRNKALWILHCRSRVIRPIRNNPKNSKIHATL